MRKFGVWVLVFLLIMCFAGCATDDYHSAFPTDTPTEPVIDVLQIYQNALPELDAACLEVSQDRAVTAGSEVFKENMDYVLTYKNLHTDDLRVNVEGTVLFEDVYNVSFKEAYLDGMIYGWLHDAGYKAEETEESLFKRYLPAVLLDAGLYDQVKLEDDNTIVFSHAKDLESWLDREEYELLEASGTATIGEDGLINQYTYCVSYTYGAARIDLDISMKVTMREEIIPAPDKYLTRIEVHDPAIPLLVERGYGYLLQSRNLSFYMEEMVGSEAFYAAISSSTTCDMAKEDKLQALITTDLQAADLNGANLESAVTQIFYDDGLVFIRNGEVEEEPIAVPQKNILQTTEKLLERYYPDIRIMDEVYVTDLPGGVVIDYTYKDYFDERLGLMAVASLTEDPYYLNDIASDYRLELAEGSLAIDKYSGLPTAISSAYSGVHTIDQTDCALIYQALVSIDGVSQSAYYNINGTLPEPDDTLEQPKPAFYKVTGPEGQQMWLLGTIHVGDARTQDLPQALLTAFQESDALAVEFDMNDFEDQLEESSELAKEVLLAYVYSDGSTIDTHLTLPDLYQMAFQTMKMTGQMNTAMLMMKPVIWSDLIDDFFMRQGYQYSTLYGVDMQLLNMAQAQEKKILNVESGIQQLHMLTNYSDEVQEMMLAASLSRDPIIYNQQLDEMFELWCTGDEEALRALLAVDTSEMTEEELQLYRDYEKAMSTDRNTQMLEVAKGYLESGDTVFYAVGLAHLLAEDGLVNTLRQAGYTVEKVTY